LILFILQMTLALHTLQCSFEHRYELTTQ
jgi:hypothetical protein